MKDVSSSGLTAELFPIEITTFPSLTAYQLDVRGSELNALGGKVAFRLQQTFPDGHWVWTKPWIVTDHPQPDEVVATFLSSLRNVEAYQSVRALEQVQGHWQPTAQALADFVARGVGARLEAEVFKASHDPWKKQIGQVCIMRLCDVRGWVVQGQPALSISIGSRLLSLQTVQSYLTQGGSLDQLIDGWVMDRASGMKGIVVGSDGTVAEHRGWLFQKAGRVASRKFIEQAADHEPVILVRKGPQTYYYVASALRPLIGPADYARFQIDPATVVRQLHLAPEQRAKMVRRLALALQKRKFIAPAFRSDKTAAFLKSEDVHFTSSVLIGNGESVMSHQLYVGLKQHGFYQRAARWPEETPLQIGILNLIPSNRPSGVDLVAFGKRLKQELQAFHFASRVVTVERSDPSREHLEEAMLRLQDKQVDVVLAFFPDDLARHRSVWGTYHDFKSLALGQDWPSQVITLTSMRGTHALANIALGMLSKVGHIPFVLASPLPYADLIVGIDIARARKTHLKGSLNALAVTRFYGSQGGLLQYVLQDAPVEGETIPEHILRALFPRQLCAGKRILVHRDGPFRGQEKAILKTWGASIKAEFFLVEVIKNDLPRLYGYAGATVMRPEKGTALRLDEQTALLVSSLPPFDQVTPAPLLIKAEAPFRIEEALHSVLTLTQLHYGSLRQPRLPVTLHYSDEIASFALRGLMPKSKEGTLPFWL